MYMYMKISVNPYREGHGGPGANRAAAESGGTGKGHSGSQGDNRRVHFGLLVHIYIYIYIYIFSYIYI